MAFMLVAFVLLSASVTTAFPLKFAGINIAGFDFGCEIDGTCNVTRACPPLKQFNNCGDGLGQMRHFVEDDGFNMFRLPCGWQYLTYGKMTGELNVTQFTNYNMLVDACLSTGAHCIIDIHNYARFDGKIIGQGGPSNEIFADLWRNIAKHWKDEERVIFGIMNEPHHIPVHNIETWADTVQDVVNAIRLTGATSQTILLPGTNFTSAETFISTGSAAALNRVTNPDGSTTCLVMDVHQYLDFDDTGSHVECVTNNIQKTWDPLTKWLCAHGRQALLTETGGGSRDSCVAYLSQQIAFLAANSDTVLGYVAWGAGAFTGDDYLLADTPVFNGTAWVDKLTVSMALSPKMNRLVASVVHGDQP